MESSENEKDSDKGYASMALSRWKKEKDNDREVRNRSHLEEERGEKREEKEKKGRKRDCAIEKENKT